MAMPRLILASRSRARRELLEQAGYEVQVVVPEVVEPDPATFDDLGAGLFQIAQLKARRVAETGAKGLILAADTVGFVAGQVFGKPADRVEARAMLAAISGTTHEVLTGWCLWRTRDELILGGVERTILTMRPWTDAERNAYLDSGEWIGKSGAYGLQFPADPFVIQIEGSAANVVGVPIERLQQILAEFPSLLAEDSPARPRM
jgi:septum formation protein